MVKIRALVLAGVAASLLVIPASAAQAVTPPEGVTAQLVTINGSGCSDQVGEVTLSPEGDSFTLTFSDFLATPRRVKACTAVVQVTAPEGYSYAVTGASYSGLAALPDGSRGVIRTTTWFQGGQSLAESWSLDGPLLGTWDHSVAIPDEHRVFSACGAGPYLVLSASVRVAGSSSAQLVFAGDVPVTLDWATC